MDVAAGGSLGLLLGLLVGLSGSPIVSSVVTGLVALLAGLFGLSEKISSKLTSAATRRLIGFAATAVITTPVAIYVRTHDLLAPSVSAQRGRLAEIGIQEKEKQDEMLRFLYFGILPAGTSAVPKDSAAGAVVSSHQSVLFAQPAAFCTALLQLSNGPERDVLALFEQQSAELKEIANLIRRLSDAQRQQALSAARIYLCRVS